MDNTRMVAIRNTVPSTIRTNGPERDRRGRGGGAMGGTPGVITGLGMPWLDMVHLARRGCLIRVRRRLRGSDIRWNTRRSRGRRAWRQGTNVSAGGSIALHQLDDSNHQQNCGPCSAEAHAGDAVEQKKYAQSDEHRGSHEPAGAASV